MQYIKVLFRQPSTDYAHITWITSLSRFAKENTYLQIYNDYSPLLYSEKNSFTLKASIVQLYFSI